MRLLLTLTLTFIISCVSSQNAPENFSRINPYLYCGGSPEPVQFKFLKEQGIKSIICVDGARPDLSNAGKSGIIYRHVPVTYATITLEQQKQLAKAYDELEKPVYIHCHHGRHRGPAAAAIVLKNHFDWENSKLVEFLKHAGTSPSYPGLYKVVSESFHLDKESWLSLKIPEQAEAGDMAEKMAELDRIWVKLKKDLTGTSLTTEKRGAAQHESLLIREHFVELKRLPDTEYDEAYEEIIKKIKLLELSLKDQTDYSGHFEVVEKDCKTCHREHRN